MKAKKKRTKKRTPRKCLMCIWEDMERERRNTDKTHWDDIRFYMQ